LPYRLLADQLARLGCHRFEDADVWRVGQAAVALHAVPPVIQYPKRSAYHTSLALSDNGIFTLL